MVMIKSLTDYEKVFESANLSSPTPVDIETISVTVSGATDMAARYADAFIRELERKSVPVAKQLAFTGDELVSYFNWTLKQRVAIANNDKVNTRILRMLWIPAFWSIVLNSVGTVWDRDAGLKIVPVFDGSDVITDEQAVEISNRLQYASEVITVVQGFCLTPGGDADMMMCALINHTVKSISKVPSVKEVIAAYLASTVDTKFNLLYRYSMDNLSFVSQAADSSLVNLVS